MFRPRSIDQTIEKIKTLSNFMDKREVYSITIIIVVALSAFFIGRLSFFERNRAPVVLERFYTAQTVTPEVQSLPVETTRDTQKSVPREPIEKPVLGAYVGSRLGNKYHLPSCPGAKQITDVNKIWFSSKEEAERAGYTKAGNCKGI